MYARTQTLHELKQVRLAQASSQCLDLISPLAQAGSEWRNQNTNSLLLNQRVAIKLIVRDCMLCRQVLSWDHCYTLNIP